MKSYRISFSFKLEDLGIERRILLGTDCWQVHFSHRLSSGSVFVFAQTFYHTNNEEKIPWHVLGKIAMDRFEQSAGIHPTYVPMWTYDVRLVEEK